MGGGRGGRGMGIRRREAWKDKEPPWLIRVNVMANGQPQMMVAVPERFTVGIGDWVEFYAAASAPPNSQEQPYKLELEIEGEAVEKIASVRPAKFMPSNLFGLGRNPESHPIMMPFTARAGGRERVPSSFGARVPARPPSRQP